MYTGRIINKVPGHLLAEDQKEKQGYIGDLSTKTIPQLNELLERQVKLLGSKAFIKKLADKGEKITRLKDSIDEELKKRSESENLTRMMSAMTMNGKQDLDELEWTGRCAPGYIASDEGDKLSDDEQNPFKILSTHSGAGFHKKKHKIIKPEKPLIKPSDLTDGSETEEEVIEEYARHLCDKLDSVKMTSQPKMKFLPSKTLKGTSYKKAEMKMEVASEKKGGRRWEVTAATPPPPVHGDTKLVSLQESIRLQCDQEKKLKEVQMKHAMERLSACQGTSMSRPFQTTGAFRDPASGSSSEDEQEHSDHEVHDEEYPDGGGVVVYNLVDDTND